LNIKGLALLYSTGKRDQFISDSKFVQQEPALSTRKSDPNRVVKHYAAQAEKYGLDIDRTKAEQKLSKCSDSLYDWMADFNLRKAAAAAKIRSFYNRGFNSNIKIILAWPFSLFKSAQCNAGELAFNFQELI
jgi:hypothetical protein